MIPFLPLAARVIAQRANQVDAPNVLVWLDQKRDSQAAAPPCMILRRRPRLNMAAYLSATQRSSQAVTIGSCFHSVPSLPSPAGLTAPREERTVVQEVRTERFAFSWRSLCIETPSPCIFPIFSMLMQKSFRFIRCSSRDIEAWSYENWTSRLLALKPGASPFRELEKRFQRALPTKTAAAK